jgi:hypothetical protein
VSINSRGYTLGEEFTDFVLVDEKRQSVILNIEKEFFKTVYREYKKLGFKLIHVTKFNGNQGVTCVFVRSVKV